YCHVDRERCERRQAAEEPRRNEGAMPRRRQRILLRRWMNKRIDVFADRREEIHCPCARPAVADALPLIYSDGSCQSRLKRKLKAVRRSRCQGACGLLSERDPTGKSHGMVNGRLQILRNAMPRRSVRLWKRWRTKRRGESIIQIVGKLESYSP